jgi:hypothetical protein
MAVSTIVTTAGAASANSYCDLATAEQYHLDRPAVGTTWSAATNDQKVAALLWATKLLDALYEWTGSVVNDTQALLWPRSGMAYRNGYSVPTTVIPVELQYATAEYARQLLAADRAGDSDVETQGITSISAGSVSLTFKDAGVVAKQIPDAVFFLLPASWGRPRGRSSGVRELVRA